MQVLWLASLGVVAAALQAGAKLRLGIPGHSAVLWLVPLVLARCVASLGGAGSVATTTMALGLYGFGGFSLRWPLVLSFGTFWVVGPVLDLLAAAWRGRLDPEARAKRISLGIVCLVMGGVGNLSHLGAKAVLGVIRPHTPRLGLPPGLYEAVTYLVFGVAAGALAWALAAAVLASRSGSRPC